MILRFYFFPYTFKASFLHPTESLFVPAAAVSFGTILINVTQYGPGNTGNWLNEAIGVLFWFQATLSVVFSAGIYLLLYVSSLYTSGMFSTRFYPIPTDSTKPHSGKLTLIQVVNANVHNSSNDSDLDIPSLPNAYHRAPRRSTECNIPARTRPPNCHRWDCYPGSRLPRLHDGLLRLYLPPNDAKAPKGESQARNVCLRRAKCLYRRWYRNYGRQRKGYIS